MYKSIIMILVLTFIVSVPEASARDDRLRFSIADVLAIPENASRLEGVTFYFGEQSHPGFTRNHGEFRTNKKTNAFNKSDLQACQRAMMSAMLQLHKKAMSLGANAVVNILSNYKDDKVSSDTEFVCGAGGIMAGVALIGTFVELE